MQGYRDLNESHQEDVVISVRRATLLDVSAIQNFIGENSFILSKRFGNYEIRNMVETHFISVVAETSSNQIVGFASLEFEGDDIDFESSKLEINNRNANWVKFLHYEPYYGEEVLQEILSTLFITFPEVDNICFHPSSSSGSDYFSQLSMFKKENCVDLLGKETSLFVCERNKMNKGVKKLIIRKAVVEDNDDIIPLLQLTQNITSLHTEGDYFFANLLYEQDDRNKILLATDEETGEVIGVMYVSSEVDVRQILTDYKTENGNVPIYDDFISETLAPKNETSFQANAFEIKLFYILDEYKFRSIDFLKEAFNAFPELKYCLIGLPFEEQDKSDHPVLKQFIYIEPTLECSMRSLHILPRVSLAAEFVIVKATETTLDKNSSPEETILQLLGQAEFDEEFIGAVAKSFKGTRYVTMLLFDKNSAIEGQNEIIGIIVIDNNVNEFLLRRHFEFTEYLDYSAYPSRGTCQGIITHFYIEQKFFRYSKLFIKEVMKKLNKLILYYGCVRGEVPNSSLNRELILLKSTRQIEYSETSDDLRESTPSPMMDNESVISSLTHNSSMTTSSGGSRMKTHISFDSLYFINRRFLSEEKTEINSRILVIGGSKTGLSFIKALSSQPHLFFSNITIVSPEEDVTKSPEFYADDTDEEFSNKELLNMVSLPNIYFIKDKLEDIDRHNKRAILYDNQSGFVTYDMLILCTSRQYKMKPKYLELPHYPTKGIVNLNSRIQLSNGDEVDLSDVLKSYLTPTAVDRYREDNSFVIIYGSTLDALCTARALMTRLSVDPSKILLVFPEGKKVIFNENEEIEEKLDQILESCGLKYYMYYSLEDFASDDEGNLIKVYLTQNPSEEEAIVKKNNKVVEVESFLFINCHTKDVDDGILSTVNRQSLVFDARLIVDTQFKTTDPYIYSVGPMAKFSRRFGESRMMEAFNSSEVGAKLGDSILYDLGVGAEDFNPTAMPTFNKNTSVRCMLPGGVRFFRCVSSRFEVEKCIKLATDYLDHRSEIDSCFRYTSIYVDKQTNCIECICYLGQEKVEESNLASLVGFPVTYFNDLIIRYNQGLIFDLISFLRENWVMAILCYKFLSFKNDVKKRLLKESEAIGNINDVCNEIADLILRGDTETLTKDPTLYVDLDKKTSKDAKIFVQSELIDFLAVHQEVLHSIPAVYYVPKKN